MFSGLLFVFLLFRSAEPQIGQTNDFQALINKIFFREVCIPYYICDDKTNSLNVHGNSEGSYPTIIPRSTGDCNHFMERKCKIPRSMTNDDIQKIINGIKNIKRERLIIFGTAQSIDALIKDIYQGGSGTGNQATGTVQGNSGNPGGSDTDACTCVPYYQCNNNTINTDGAGLNDIRVQDGVCADYLEICCNSPVTVNPVNPITEKPPINKTTGCGRRNPEGVGFRITGDNDNKAQFAEFPWMVAILREETVEGYPNKLNVYQCGGALIHPSVVLTAGHCVTGKDKHFKVRAGEWDTQTKNEILPHQDREVKQVIVHKDFNAGALFNDVALLFLKEPVEIAGNVNVVCLPPQDLVLDRSRCFASGWGKDFFGKEGKYQVILKKLELPVVNRGDCQDKLRKTRLGNHFQLHKSFICAGGEVGKDTCRGDGGSPLVCPVPGEKDRYLQAGIVAWGIGCGENQLPGVYVNIPFFRHWIDDQMSAYGYDSSSYSY